MKHSKLYEALVKFTILIDVPRNIPSKWSCMERSDPRRKYHTWKTSKIENIKCDDHPFLASDIRATQQEQSADYKLSRFGHLSYSGSSGTKESRKSSSYLPSVSCRFFSSRSCIEIQQPIRTIENLRNNLSANALIVRLRSMQSHSGVLMY